MWGCYYQHPDKLDGGLRHYDIQKHEKVTPGELPIDAFIFVRLIDLFLSRNCRIFNTLYCIVFKICTFFEIVG